MGIKFLYNNLLDSATLTASSAATGFPAANVQNPFRGKVWRTDGTPEGVAQLVIDHGSAKEVTIVALTGYSWLTAPGILKIEFNATDVWTAPAATEYLTWTAPTSMAGNKATIILQLSASRTYRYNRLTVVAATGVSLASPAANGITVTHAAAINMTTNSFTMFFRGALTDWTPGDAIIFKTTGGAGYDLEIQATGIPRVYLNGYVNAGAAHSFVDGSEHSIAAVVTVGTVTTTVDFYADGVALGTQQSAASAGSLSNVSNLYFLGTSASIVAGTMAFAAIFNRPLSAADILALHNGGHDPYIAVADQWGSQTAQTSGTVTTGKKYRIGTYHADDDFTNIGAASNTSGVEFTATGTTPTHWAHSSELFPIGAVGAWELSGVQAADWQDSSSNNNDGAYPAAGCTVNGEDDWDLGRKFVGTYLEPVRSWKRRHSGSFVDPSMVMQTIGGQDHVDEIEMYRTMEFSLMAFSQAEFELIQTMINTVGIHQDLWIAFDYANEPNEQTIYGKFTSLPGFQRDRLIDLPFSFKESR